VSESLQQGRYLCLGTLGEGSQGRTFDGTDTNEGRPVAIKRFDVRGAKGWKDVELAEREARVLQSLSHPKLPRYIDHFEQDGALYLVMEKIEGESLASLRKRGVTLDEEWVLRLLSDASDVLDYLHSRSPPVVHRDLKPGNVIRRPDGSYAFVDFGAVRDRLRPEGGSTVVGTFGYMAPEQFQGRAVPASDVYAIGATAMAMLTGREPEDLPHQGLGIRVREALGRRASGRLVRALESMLDPDPDRRSSRIAPLLEGQGSSPRRHARHPHAPHASLGFEPLQLEQLKLARGAEQRARELGRRAERRARKLAWRAEQRARRASGRRFAWPLELLFTLAFALGIVWVTIATQVVVPVILRVLSLFFARNALVSAADAVREAGARAVQEMARSRRWMMADGDGAAQDRARVEPGDGPRVRVAEGEPDRSTETDAEEEDPAGRTRGTR